MSAQKREVEEELRREMERKQQMQAALEQTRDALAHARDSARRLALVKQQAAESKEELTGRLEQQVHGQEPCTQIGRWTRQTDVVPAHVDVCVCAHAYIESYIHRSLS